MSKLKNGYYYIENNKEKEMSLVKVYDYEGKKVVGFNVADGGSFLPVSDLTEDTTLYPVKISMVAVSTKRRKK